MKRRLFLPWLQAEVSTEGAEARAALQRIYTDVEGLDPVTQVLYVDTRSNLPDDLLMVGDKTSMANSLEARVPYLDHRLVELVEQMPPGLKLRGLSGKYLHKKALARWVPREVVRRKKKGFANPVDEWLRGRLKGYVTECLLAERIRSQQLFRSRLHQAARCRARVQQTEPHAASLPAHLFRAVAPALHRGATAMTASVDLSIIIVNWNSLQFLRQCLCTVYARPHGFSLEVIVIDNASYDGSAELLAAEFPQVQFVQGMENIGFARANNAAFAVSTGRAILFLNPDTEVLGDALERMLALLETSADAGAVGCRLLNTDGSLQTSCVQPFPTILNQVFDSELLRRWFPRAEWWGMRALLDANGSPASVEVVSGACLMVSRIAFERVGRFSEDYFMYAEDLDLCFKLRSAGFQNYYRGDVSVIHHGGQSTSAKAENQFGNVLMRESVFRYLRRHRGRLYAGGYRLTVAGAAVVRLGILAAAWLLTAGRSSRLSLENGIRKWKALLRWSLGRERWAPNLGDGSA